MVLGEKKEEWRQDILHQYFYICFVFLKKNQFFLKKKIKDEKKKYESIASKFAKNVVGDGKYFKLIKELLLSIKLLIFFEKKSCINWKKNK